MSLHARQAFYGLVKRAALATTTRQVCCSPVLASNNVELDDDGLPKDYKLKKLHVGSRRLDTFVSRSTGKSSSQTEKLILGGRVRVNDEVHTKKSYNVAREDVVDVWIGPLKDNNELANVERTEIVDYEVTERGYQFEVKSWKKFLVDNWRGGASS